MISMKLSDKYATPKVEKWKGEGKDNETKKNQLFINHGNAVVYDCGFQTGDKQGA